MARLAPRRSSCRLALVSMLLGMLVVAGCGGTATRSEGSHQHARAAGLGVPRTLVVRTARRCTTGADFSPSGSQSFAAVVRLEAAVRTRPSGGARLIGRFRRVDQNGFPTVFAVLGARVRGCRAVWFRVQVPSPPNGTAGWIHAPDVRVYPVSSRVAVDLSRREVSVYRWGRLALRVRVAVGAAATPTPLGRFYVNERFLLDSANGPFGVAALGISAHSEVLHDWVQGGPIALHGTDDPGSIGNAVSHGCIRLANADMRRLFTLAPAGTPVVIHP